MGPEDRPKLYAAIHQLHSMTPDGLPVVVVVGDDGDRLKLDLSCHAGEIMATTMKTCGAVGLVTDGGLRDIAEVKGMGGLHYFGRGLVVAHGRPIIYDVGAIVNINGVFKRIVGR
jgi:regulator of RNase E activity RraA